MGAIKGDTRSLDCSSRGDLQNCNGQVATSLAGMLLHEFAR